MNDVCVVHVECLLKCVHDELEQIIDVLSTWKGEGTIRLDFLFLNILGLGRTNLTFNLIAV